MRFYCLINPLSGGKRGRDLIVSLQQLKRNGDLEGEIAEIDYQQLDRQLEYAKEFDALLVGGGDGTVSRILSLCKDQDIIIGILPLGTGNDLAKELGVYKSFSLTAPEKLINYYKSGRTKEITLWKLEYGDAYESFTTFCNYLSFGLDGVVVKEFSQWRDQFEEIPQRIEIIRNRLFYLLSSLRHGFYSFSLHGVKIRCEEKELSSFPSSVKTLMFSNISSCLGLGISNPRSSPFDEELEAIVNTSLLNYLTILSSYHLPFFRPVEIGTGQVWELLNMPKTLPLQIDGESHEEIQSTKYRIQQAGKVQVLVGSEQLGGILSS